MPRIGRILKDSKDVARFADNQKIICYSCSKKITALTLQEDTRALVTKDRCITHIRFACSTIRNETPRVTELCYCFD